MLLFKQLVVLFCERIHSAFYSLIFNICCWHVLVQYFVQSDGEGLLHFQMKQHYQLHELSLN